MDPSDRHPRCRAHHAWRDMLIYTTVGFVAVMLIPGDDDHAQWVAAGAGLVVGGTFGGLRDRHECREWKRILARTKPAT